MKQKNAVQSLDANSFVEAQFKWHWQWWFDQAFKPLHNKEEQTTERYPQKAKSEKNKSHDPQAGSHALLRNLKANPLKKWQMLSITVI